MPSMCTDLLQMNNMSAMEINAARPVFMKAMDQFRELNACADEVKAAL